MSNTLKLVIIVSLVMQSAWAGQDIDQDDAKALKQKGLILPLERILQAAQHVHPGRVLEVELEKKGDLYIYEIEISDSNGQVWEMKFNASDASLLSQERED